MEKNLERRELYQKEITRLEIENEKWRLLHQDEDEETSEDYTSEEDPEPQEAGTTLGDDFNESPEDYKVYEKCVELHETTRDEMQATFNRYLKDKLRTNFTDASPKDRTGRCPAGYGHYSIIRRKSDVDKLKGLSKEARKEVLSKRVGKNCVRWLENRYVRNRQRTRRLVETMRYKRIPRSRKNSMES